MHLIILKNYTFYSFFKEGIGKYGIFERIFGVDEAIYKGNLTMDDTNYSFEQKTWDLLKPAFVLDISFTP